MSRKYSREQIQFWKDNLDLGYKELMERNNRHKGFHKIEKYNTFVYILHYYGLYSKNLRPKKKKAKKQEPKPLGCDAAFAILAEHIIKQAKKDYKNGIARKDYTKIKEVERFVRSEWFQLLTCCDYYIEPDKVLDTWKSEGRRKSRWQREECSQRR